MADKKKISTEETENNIKDSEKKDKLDALLLGDDEDDYDETSDEVEFDAFMAEYRDLVSKRIGIAAAEPEETEEDNPEEVLITLPKKNGDRKPKRRGKKDESKNSDWDDKITLDPEEYDEIDEVDMHLELPDEQSSIIGEETDEFDLGEESDDDSFQLSINFSGDDTDKGEEECDTEDSVSTYDPEKPRAIDWVFDIAEMFVFVLLAVMILTTFFFRHSIVEGRSMMNTLEDGDHLIISDFLYSPERGDIVVFEDYSTSLRKAVVKRVIGLPGDTVMVSFNELGDVVVYLNGELLEEEYAFNAKDANIDIGNFDKEIIVPEGEIFVMGDNRYHSTDSRSNGVGTVKIDAILGKVILRFLPFNKFGTVE